MKQTRAKGAAGNATEVTAIVRDTSLEGKYGETLVRQPYTVEIDGVLYRREGNQEKARESLERSRRWDRLLEMVDGRPELLAAIREFELDIGAGLTEEFEETMRRTGWMLVANGLADMWKVVFLDWQRGNAYALGDESRFLLRRPTGQVTPLKDDF